MYCNLKNNNLKKCLNTLQFKTRNLKLTIVNTFIEHFLKFKLKMIMNQQALIFTQDKKYNLYV